MSSRVVMPKLSDTMEEGVLLKWYKHEGDKVESGDVLAEIETDKAVMDLEAYASGILKKVLVEEKSVVPAGDLIALIAGEDEEVSPEEIKGSPDGKKPKKELKPQAEKEAAVPEPPPEQSAKHASPSGGKVLASPLAKSMAREEGIDLSGVRGSGPGGRIVRKDVEPLLKGGVPGERSETTAATESSFTDRPLSMMRKAITQKMVRSKAPVPHFYVTSEVGMEKSLEVKSGLEALEEVRVSVTDLWIRAASLAIQKFPQMNASFMEDKIRYHGSVDVGIAVGLEEGLIVPVLRNCGGKGLRQIARESRVLIDRARSRKLTPEEYSGATFSISNLGMADVENFVAVITPPESAALALGSIREVPTVTDGKIQIGLRMKVTLSCDHRVIDGLQAALFLKECKKILEHPVLLTL